MLQNSLREILPLLLTIEALDALFSPTLDLALPWKEKKSTAIARHSNSPKASTSSTKPPSHGLAGKGD